MCREVLALSNGRDQAEDVLFSGPVERKKPHPGSQDGLFDRTSVCALWSGRNNGGENGGWGEESTCFLLPTVS